MLARLLRDAIDPDEMKEWLTEWVGARLPTEAFPRGKGWEIRHRYVQDDVRSRSEWEIRIDDPQLMTLFLLRWS